MPRTSSSEVIKRLEIPYFEGLNALVAHNIAKKQEPRYLENARSPQIGNLEKRKGFTALGNDITATANHDLFFFGSNNLLSTGLFRISDVAGVCSAYYLNVGNVWTALTSGGTGLSKLGFSDTQFDITNTSGTTYRYTYDTTGTNPLIELLVKVGDILNINAQNFAAGNKGTFTVTSVGTNYFEVTNAAGVVEGNKTIGTGYILHTTQRFSHVQAESRMFLVNGIDNNRYISADGLTVVDSSTTTGHLYGSPKARKVNHYKDKMYVADYIIGTTRYKNSIMRSSVPLGLVCLVTADALTGVTSVSVADTTYIHTTDSLDVYRGSVYITTLTVSAKTTSTITVAATGADIKAADEIWVAGTFTGERIFRWASNPSSGTPAAQYDTFKLSGGDNSEITMLTNIGNVQMIASKSTMASWNDYNLVNFDSHIGCVSPVGYVNSYNMLFFMHYTGIYVTTGDQPRLISAKVEEYFVGATTSGLENGAMGRKGLSVFACIGDVTLYNPDGSTLKTLTDVCLEYDIKQENWYVHTNIPASALATYISSTDPDRLCFTNSNNFKIYEFLSGSTDDSAEIPFSMTTSDLTLSASFEKICFPQQVVIEAESGSGIRCFVSLDESEFYEIKGEAKKGCTLIKVTPKNEDVAAARCRKIKIRISEFSKGMCKISRIALVYKETQEEELSHA